MRFGVSERRATGRETVQALVRTWNCFKISCLLKVQFRVSGVGMPVSNQITEWFAPGFGGVKNGGLEWRQLESSSLLTSIQP